jgi:hypothetical protein
MTSPQCRVVEVDLMNPGSPDTWQDVVPQHDKDLLQWAAALKVLAQQLSLCHECCAVHCGQLMQ